MSRPDIQIQRRIELPPAQLEESLLNSHSLIAACFLHPDDPRRLEFDDVRRVVSDAEELAAAAGFGF